MGRLAKQLVYSAAYLAVFGLIGFGLYGILVPDPTCYDGIANQGEEGVDCGSVCGVLCGAPLEPLTVSEPGVFAAGEGTDVLVELTNDNVVYGAARVDYELTLSDASGPLTHRRGFTYANPLGTRYLILSFPGIPSAGITASFSYDPSRIQWFEGRLPETQVVEFSVTQEKLSVASGSVEYTALVGNLSTFDFEEVDVSVVLLDAGGRPIGVGATVMRTVPSGETRAVTVQWPFELPGTPVRARAYATTNVFDNDNFIRTYGGQEPFQGF